MGRPKQDPVKDVARRILALTTEQRNALDVAMELYGEMSAPEKIAPKPRRKPKPAPEASNG